MLTSDRGKYKVVHGPHKFSTLPRIGTYFAGTDLLHVREYPILFWRGAFSRTLPKRRRGMRNEPVTPERRQHERYSCQLMAACSPAAGSVEQVWQGRGGGMCW